MGLIIAIFGALLIFIFMGIPIAFSIGLASLASIFIFDINIPLTLLPGQMFSGIDSFALMAIPFFVFSGEIMNKAGITMKIFNLAEAFVGHLKAGLAHVNVLASLIMAGISGSGTADCAALATVEIPAMVKKGYGKEFTAALTAVSDVVGPIIPPSTLMILYAYFTNTSVAKLFLSGVIPGLLLGLGFSIVSAIICKKEGYGQETQPFSVKKVIKALKEGGIALILPLFIIFAIVRGIATATEVGVIVAVISLCLGVINKTISSIADFKEVIVNSVYTSSTIFTMLATSGIFSNILVRAHFTEIVVNVVSVLASTPAQTLFVIFVFLFILGMFIDVTPMIIMFSVPFATAARNVGIPSEYFGVLFIIFCMIGAVTPPVGGILFIVTSVAKIRMTSFIRYLIPFYISMTVIVMLLILFPELVTFLPQLLFQF